MNPSDPQAGAAPVSVGDTVSRDLRFTERDLESFATASGDWNPVHYDAEAARLSVFGAKVASGAHTSALLQGLATSHFSRRTDGIRRQAVALNFNFSFKGPVHADEDLHLTWTVHAVQWNAKLKGWVAELQGDLSPLAGGDPRIVARGTLLVQLARA